MSHVHDCPTPGCNAYTVCEDNPCSVPQESKCIECLRAENKALLKRIEAFEWNLEMACENTPTRGCECPGCELARERADNGDAGP